MTIRVLALGAILAVGVLPMFGRNRWCSGVSCPCEDEIARFQMSNIADAIGMFRARRHVLPASLDALTEPDEGVGEPYIDKVPNDPWDQRYGYSVIDERAGRFEIVSAGPDRTLGTDDDLAYPDRAR